MNEKNRRFPIRMLTIVIKQKEGQCGKFHWIDGQWSISIRNECRYTIHQWDAKAMEKYLINNK